ncbi:MAG: hypothetical protein OQJ81_12375 [Melioribacteraceae bacterium]|nr:hypothetical protein [Melioribacteraceae bacterium]
MNAKFKNKLKSLKNDILTYDDIAMAAIIPLFVKNKNGEIAIKSSISNWKDELETESDYEYFLSKIIWRRVDQAVTGILKERDPFFEKILKTLNVCINTTELKKIRYFGTVLVLENQFSSVTKPVITETEFSLIPEKLFTLKQSELFFNIFHYIKENTHYAPAIPLNLLVKRIRNSFLSEIKFLSCSGFNAPDEMSINEIVNNGLIEVKEKLDIYYVSKNKIRKDDADFIYAAFKNISKDMMNGGIQDSLFNYLKDFNKTLTKDTFYIKYHHIMNYLLTNFKNNIKKNVSV